METNLKQINYPDVHQDVSKWVIKEGMYMSKLQNKTTAKTIVACDHEFLQSYSECSYFEKEYIKRRNKKGHKLPVKCSVCNVFIVNKLE